MTHYVENSDGEIVSYTDEEWFAMGAVHIAELKIKAARNERDRLLKATDFYALSDRTMSAEMTAYRQALRDIPAQEGFPDNVTWPTKPEA